MVFLHGYFLFEERARIAQGYPDFSVYYTAGRMIRAGLGTQLYSPAKQFQVQQQFTATTRQGPLPYIHPPFEALPFVPLALLPYGAAFVLWNALSLSALFVTVLLLRRHSRILAGISLFDCWLAQLAFFPVFVTVLQGQDSIFLLLLVTLAYDAMTRRADTLAGFCFGIALFKFQFSIPLVLLLVLWGKRKLGVIFFATGLALTLASLAITGWHGLLDYPRLVIKIATNPLAGRTPPDVMPNLHGLVEGWSNGFQPAAAFVVIMLVSVAAFAAAAKAGRGLKVCDWPGAFSLAVLVAVLVSYQANAHDLTLLVLPIVLLVDRMAPVVATGGRWMWTLVFPLLPLLISPVWIALWLKWGHINLLALPLIWLAVMLATGRSTRRDISLS
jgi:hypothetical protein